MTCQKVLSSKRALFNMSPAQLVQYTYSEFDSIISYYRRTPNNSLSLPPTRGALAFFFSISHQRELSFTPNSTIGIAPRRNADRKYARGETTLLANQYSRISQSRSRYNILLTKNKENLAKFKQFFSILKGVGGN